MARKPSDLVQVKIRMPERLRRLIEAEAKKTKRTLTQEMVERLEKSFGADDGVMQLLTDSLKKMAEHIGRPDIAAEITARQKQEGDSNG